MVEVFETVTKGSRFSGSGSMKRLGFSVLG